MTTQQPAIPRPPTGPPTHLPTRPPPLTAADMERLTHEALATAEKVAALRYESTVLQSDITLLRINLSVAYEREHRDAARIRADIGDKMTRLIEITHALRVLDGKSSPYIMGPPICTSSLPKT